MGKPWSVPDFPGGLSPIFPVVCPRFSRSPGFRDIYEVTTNKIMLRGVMRERNCAL